MSLMNQEQPKSHYDAPEPPWHLKSKQSHPKEIPQEEKGIQLVQDDDEPPIPMSEEGEDEPLEMPDADAEAA